VTAWLGRQKGPGLYKRGNHTVRYRDCVTRWNFLQCVLIKSVPSEWVHPDGDNIFWQLTFVCLYELNLKMLPEPISEAPKPHILTLKTLTNSRLGSSKSNCSLCIILACRNFFSIQWGANTGANRPMPEKEIMSMVLVSIKIFRYHTYMPWKLSK
jgi:hypothetical protein